MAAVFVSIYDHLRISRENCTAWLHEVLLAMLLEQRTVVFLYQLDQARPHNVLHVHYFTKNECYGIYN